jgi:hypothetical protein
MSEEYPSDPTGLVIGGTRGALRAEDLLQSALKRARRESFSDASVLRSLERLIEACNEEADLSTLGMRALRIDIMRCLKNLLRFDALEDDYPSVLTRPIRAPVFITGMPRSGTTFLHRLILQDQRTAGPRLFELMYPCAGRATRWGAGLRKSWVSLQLALFGMIVPELSALHPVAAEARGSSKSVASARDRQRGCGVAYLCIPGSGGRRSAGGELSHRRERLRHSPCRRDRRIVRAARPGPDAWNRDVRDRRARRPQLVATEPQKGRSIPVRTDRGVAELGHSRLAWRRGAAQLQAEPCLLHRDFREVLARRERSQERHQRLCGGIVVPGG